VAKDDGAVQNPRTLKEAHEALARLRPAQDASLGAWLKFREAGVSLYKRMADIDRFHHHEALYWVEREQEEADQIKARIQAEQSPSQ
jgi:hypothetical protein